MTEAHLNITSPTPRRVEIDPAVLSRMAKAALLYYKGLEVCGDDELLDDADRRTIELAALLKNI